MRTKNALSNNHIEYEDDLKEPDLWKIQLMITIDFMSSKDQRCSHWGPKGAMPPPTAISEPNKVQNVSVSSIREIAFYGCSEIIRTRNFTFSTVYTTSFGQFMTAFHFFLST